ncbi:hypothetical protein [Bradyrhizobium sp. BR 1432]|uniref:hypothetical protein n=1 Tax=Bradyrhizobium sp. BR 1432 TaxID=3447966 RepID=UPI003EE48059
MQHTVGRYRVIVSFKTIVDNSTLAAGMNNRKFLNFQRHAACFIRDAITDASSSPSLLNPEQLSLMGR